jgi:hypothetical protein
MQLNRTMKLSLTVSVIIFILVGLILPSNVMAFEGNENDGIWTDSFETADTTQCLSGGTSQCVWDTGTILLTSTLTGGRNYSFADGGSFKKNDHEAYYYESFFPINRFFSFLFSPALHTTREHQFDDNFQYPYIEKKGESTHRYADPSSTQGLNQYTVQHFRMKLQGTAEAIGNLYIYWYGKADNAKKIEMFYWNYGTFISTWKLINLTHDTADVTFVYNLSEAKLEQAIGPNNYIDICVVAQKKSLTNPQCMLYTDYIQLKSEQQQGYKVGYGLVQTKSPIELRVNAYWELLTWDDYKTTGASVSYQILYNNGSSYVPIEDSVLPGNEEGYTSAPVSLIPLADFYLDIKIQANLTTSDPSVSPKIFSWTVTWQTMNRWQDLFSSEYRVAVKNKVNVANGVNISLVSGDWPMYGQNPANTRASVGKAASTNDLYWWSDFHLSKNQTCGSPVVDNGALYIPVFNRDYDTGSLYKYTSIVVTSDNVGKEFAYQKIIPFSNITNGLQIVGSPAVSDQYAIVATGRENTLNYVYAFRKNSPSRSPNWTFDFSKEPKGSTNICYWGSPIVAGGKVFLTSWSGQPVVTGYHINNMILALDLSDGTLKWNYTFPPSSHPLLSPTWSFSTPAYSKGKVIVGCMNNLSNNLFAFDAENGSLLWNTSVGAIGKASPVVYNDTVYIVNEMKVRDGIRKKTKITAVNIDDGSIRWETELGRTMTTLPSLDFTACLAQSTPAIANGVLYVTSPDGLVTALDLSRNGTGLWTHEVYSNKLHPSAPILTSSPSYADGLLYVGTPDGILYALNTKGKGNESWHRQAFPTDQSLSIVTDPIVTNGLVFFGDSNGRFYVCGNYTTPNEQINGSISSIPIQLPEGVWWKQFYVNKQTNQSASINTITFSLLDADGNLIKVLNDGDNILVANRTLGRTLQLRADFWAKNKSANPKLLSWNITFFKDFKLPFIDKSTLNPNPQGWLNEIIPQFTIKVQDTDTGLLVSSAKYVLEYIAHNQTYVNSFPAQCTGVNGSTSVEQITVNLTKLDFYENITALRSLRINITDLAGNTATQYITFKQDTIKPGSYVKKQSMQPWYNANTNYIWINATSFDNGTDVSGVKLVELYYRYSTTGNFSGDWIYFANSTLKSPSWKFNFTDHPNQHGGYFEVCTIATDNANNVENFPTHGDVSFLYDWTIPNLPSISGSTLWFNEQPRFTVWFSDDFKLDTIQYRPNFTATWTTIATAINTSTYNTPWNLLSEYWNQMEEGVVYYLYFKINDTLGNIRFITDDADALIIRKDVSIPTAIVNIPASETKQILVENFTVSANVSDQQGSGIKDVSLFYRYSGDQSNWSGWTMYGTTLYSAPYKWEFNARNGDGYYEFKINVTDNAGNEAESAVFTSAVTMFPLTLSIVLISLVVVLLFLCALLYLKWRKKT